MYLFNTLLIIVKYKYLRLKNTLSVLFNFKQSVYMYVSISAIAKHVYCFN